MILTARRFQFEIDSMNKEIQIHDQKDENISKHIGEIVKMIALVSNHNISQCLTLLLHVSTIHVSKDPSLN